MDLPAPLRPATTTSSPAASVRSIARSTSRPPRATLASWAVISGGPAFVVVVVIMSPGCADPVDPGLKPTWRCSGASGGTLAPDHLHITSKPRRRSSRILLGMPASSVPTSQHDVVVVGARCAGAATAMLLARAGHDVALVDRATFPSDTLSTHAIARSGVLQLHRWGLYDRLVATGAPELRSIEFHAGESVVRRTLKPRHGVDVLLAPRRTVLDALLVDAAVEAGVQLSTGVTVEDVIAGADGRVAGVRGRSEEGPWQRRARIVVGADGLRSRVARRVGAQIVLERPAGGSTHYAYVSGDWPALEYHQGAGALGGVFPTHHGEACIWVCVPSDVGIAARRATATVDGAFQSLLASFLPALHERIQGRRASPARGATSLPNHLRASSGPGWALVGDAGYHRDPITGHGISDAFRDADLLAGAIDAVLDRADERAALERYEAQRRAMLEPIFRVTCAMSEFPSPERMQELQIELSGLIEAEAEHISAWTPTDRSWAA